MANCPNKNLEEWKLLVASRGEDVAYYLWDKYNTRVPESESKVEIVKTGLKATNILQSTKADQFFGAVARNKISGDFFWKKMQADLGIPKDQLEILKSFNTQDRGELISSLLANYSYAIEINTSKNKISVKGTFDTPAFDQYGELIEQAKESEFENTPTSYYSNLTVPGGTNYTENEIATPAITPSIKGHAQFATDQGIGWFRSDDKISEDVQEELDYDIYDIDAGPDYAGEEIGGTRKTTIVPKDKFTYAGDTYEKKQPLFDEEGYGDIYYFKNSKPITFLEFYKAFDAVNQPTKTRRILEVQSDLFQKGRDRKDLTGIPTNNVITAGIFENEEYSFELNDYAYDAVVEDIYYEEENQTEPTTVYYKNGMRISNKEMQIAKEEYKKQNIPQSQNQFLQLLNQGSNWVTFFTKSIIQDSAKKGYEKVLFPSGNTASKVEGHTTLEDFKKQKEARIKLLEEKKDYINETGAVGKIDLETGARIDYDNQSKESIDREIEQLKKELEDIEGPGGFGALKPIYNFYENTVKNVLNKQYGKENVKQVTDEYGNTWNEINIVPEREQQPIMLQKKEGPASTSASPQTLSLIKDFLKNIGVDVKSMDNIVVNGIKQDANAVALLTQKLIQVLDGKEATALPEEAMHFAVAIIKQTNPALYKKLMSEINSYAIMNEVFQAYGNDPAYQIDGKPNVIKLKEEAIAKVLVETIINNNENNTEKPERIANAEGWWEQIVNYLKNLFTKSGFDIAAMKVIKGEAIGTVEDIRENAGEMFFQLSKQQQIVESIKNVSNRIEKKAVKNELGGEEEKYFIDGKQIKNRVSNIIKTWYDEIRAQDALTDSEYKKGINTLKADKGTAGHKDFEHAFTLFVDENGKRKTSDEMDAAVLNDNHISFIDPNNNTIYELLRDNLRARFESFDKDTVFMSEVTIFDPKRDVAGTVDFLAVTPEGKVSILDWKFIGLDTLRYQDVPWYNVASWDRQMKQYKSIIKDNYGVDNKDFEQTRMIPIRAVYSEANPQTKVLPKLLQIEIGDVNIKNIKQDYLVPVGVANERVIIENDKEATKKINSLLDKLNDVYTKLAEQKVLKSERLNKNEQLNALYSAIRQLQMKQDVGPLIYQSKILNVQIQSIINNYNEQFKGRTDLDASQIEEFAKTLRLAEDALQHYLTLDLDLDFLFEGKLSDEDKQLQEDIRETAYQSRKINSNLSDIFTEFTVDQIGGTENGEKVVKGLFSRQLGTTSTIQLKGMAALYQKANAAFGRAGMDTQTEVARLVKLKSAYQAWASAKGLGAKDMFNIIKKKGSNELIDEYRSEFYTQLKRATDKNVKDIKWIKDNIDVEAYKKYLDEKRQEEYIRIDNLPRLGTQEQNENDIAAEKAKASALYNIIDDKSLGWLLYREAKQFPKTDWQSDQWKELHKKDAAGNYVNKPALDFYNYIIERNESYADIGYIPNASARTFLPWVRKGLTEKLIFGGKVTIGEQFLKNISVDEEEVGLGRFDPISGKTINKIPKYLTREFEEEASEDLFKTMSMYNEFAIKFQYLSDMENQALALLRLEKNKKAIATSMFGKTQKDPNGDLVYINDNTENSKLIEDMIKAIVYQQKYIESEAFDQLLGKFGNFGNTINSKLGFKLLPETLDGRQLSINKVITQMNNTFQVTALGLNILSSSSNYFGGTAQGYINAGKYFTKREYISTEKWLLSNKMAGDIDKKTALAALEYFVPFTDNYNRYAATKLSINKLDDQAIQDWLMILMRKGDEAVQTVNFFSFLKNAVVVNGQVVNAREYLKTTDEFKNFYQGTQSERDARAAKFENAVKELVKEQGVLNISKVVDGELIIPGVERKSDSVIEFRRKVQSFTADALGSMTEENKRLLNLNVYGNSFMVFKNWIPRLVDVRMGNVKYNAASDAYEWGRTRMIARIISDDLRGSLGNLKNSLMGNDKGIEYIRQLYEKKRADYKADTNKELEMTEDEFIDLVRQNIKNQLVDVLFYAGLWAVFLALKAMAPDDDEDPIVKNQWKFALKATDKFKDELGYFYNPTSLTNLVSQGAFPAMGLITNYEKGVVNFIKESYGLATGDDELVEKTNVIKYWMKTNPITNQAAGMLPMFYPDLAKDLGIKMQSQSGIR